MEATNISIKQQSSVSINVETLQAIKQLCNVDTLGSRFKVQCSMSLPRLYCKELRLARSVARTIDAHPTVSNIALWLMGIAIMVEVFLFA